jgi:3',5'-cyclic AMP phosphodiesterase CpdA
MLVVSDTHLSDRTPTAVTNVAALVEHDRSSRFDAVVHLGDIAVDGPGRPDDLVVAQQALAGFGAVGQRFHVIPGNHDVGDGPHAENHDGERLIDDALLERYAEVFGADRWRLDLGAWSIVAFNAQLVDTGTDLEHEQWDWLAAELAAAAAAGRFVALCTHKPLVLPDPSDAGGRRPARYFPEAAAERVLDLARSTGVRLVLTGHVHQWRRFERDGITHVWAPTAWAVLPDSVQAVLGEKVCGALELDLRVDGSFDVELVTPPGFEHHEGGTDIPNPYAQH